MKVYVRAPMQQKDLKTLENKFGEVVYEPWTVTGERYYEDEMLAKLIEYKPDILITELDKITQKVLDGYSNLKVIGDCRANPANIDVDACTNLNIPIICTPARNAQAVAEMLVGLLISYMRNLIPAVDWVKQGEWKEGTTPYFSWMGNELYNKKVGFVGFGAVGQASANLLHAFNCDVYFYDPFVEDGFESYEKVSLEYIFEECDIVSIHLPVMNSTLKMINRSLLEKMKKDSIFINTSRSAVVDMKVLNEMAQSKTIKGIILDVLDSEPPTIEDLKINLNPNVLLTPHICGATYEVSDHQSQIITDRLQKWMNNEDVSSVIFNRKVIKNENN